MIQHLMQALLGFFKTSKFVVLGFLLSGCQMGYLAKNAYHQVSLLNRRKPIAQVIESPQLSSEQKHKLSLANEARLFAESHLSLAKTENYTSFVQLEEDYVTYVVNASPKWSLDSFRWWFPIVGHVPYKGYFTKQGALEEEQRLIDKGFDTYVRGVSAYSTLGWFNDPILSSMLRYKEHHLVNTIIHETVHATLYIKGNADFNERLAVFLGNKGTESFYRKREGDSSPTLRQIAEENHDDEIFSSFISKELEDLKAWYASLKEEEKNESDRLARIKEIQQRFISDVAPKLKTTSYSYFPTVQMTNARLMLYSTYVADLGDFEALYQAVGQSFSAFLESCKELEKSDDPESDLRRLTQRALNRDQVASHSVSK